MSQWVEHELRTVRLGDKRLEGRYRQLLGRLADHPQLSIPAACGGRAETEAAYRLFDNDLIDPQRLLAPHIDATYQRALAHPVVLVVQDTTEIQFIRPHERIGGPINTKAGFHGLYAHPYMAFTPDGVPLGLVGARLWARDPMAPSYRTCRKRPFEDKESFRWLEGYRAASQLAGHLGSVTSVVAIADSEADIYDCLEEALADDTKTDKERARWLVRACHDRALIIEGGSPKRLSQALMESSVVGSFILDIKARKALAGGDRRRKAKRLARQARLDVRATRVTLKPSMRQNGRSPMQPVTVNAVLVKEVDPPESEAPVEWVLLTDLPTSTWEETQTVIDYYCARWGIEVYFKILKSGCRIEELQLETTKRLTACLAIYMIVAWRVMHLQMLGRDEEVGELPADIVFTRAEWESVYAVTQGQPPPKLAPPLREVVRMVASLGGFLGRKTDGPPGPKAMWIGLQRVRDLATGWEMRGRELSKSLTTYV
jgi:hypothetical protein